MIKNAGLDAVVADNMRRYKKIKGVSGSLAYTYKLTEYIIENAKAHLSEQDESFEDLLSDLENSRRTIEKEQAEINEYKREIEQLKQDNISLKGEVDILKQRLEKILHQYELKKDIDDVIEEIEENEEQFETMELEEEKIVPFVSRRNIIRIVGGIAAGVAIIVSGFYFGKPENYIGTAPGLFKRKFDEFFRKQCKADSK